MLAAVSTAAAQTAGPAPAAPKPATFDVKPMPFDPTKIRGLSEKILTSHYANNYTGATQVYGHAVLSIPTITNGGMPSPIGASSNSPTNLQLGVGIFTDGTLLLTGATAAIPAAPETGSRSRRPAGSRRCPSARGRP